MVLFQKVSNFRVDNSYRKIILLGFTDPINVKFANTPNAAKSMIGLPLAPTYLPGIPTPQQAVLTTVPPIRQQLNRYRYDA